MGVTPLRLFHPHKVWPTTGGGGARYTWGSHLSDCFTPTMCGQPPGGGGLGTRGGHTSQTVSPPQGVADHRGGGGLGTRGGHTSQTVSPPQGVADHRGGARYTWGSHLSDCFTPTRCGRPPGGGGGLGTRGGHTSQTVSPPQGVANHRGGGLGTQYVSHFYFNHIVHRNVKY